MRFPVFISVVLLILMISSLLSLSLGASHLPPLALLQHLLIQFVPQEWLTHLPQLETGQHLILYQFRLPRLLIAATVGAALAVAGVVMQGLLQNPLASPDVIGVSAGASLGAVLSFILGLASYSLWAIPLFAFIGSSLVLSIVYWLGYQHGKTAIADLLLIGIAINALCGALTGLLISQAWAAPQIAEEILFWLMGSLEGRQWWHVSIMLPSFGIAYFIILCFQRELDLLLFGQESAAALGVDVEKIKWILLFATTLLTASAVAVSGVIGFIGLIIPHTVRLLIGSQHRYLLPASACIGATFLMLMDLLARTLQSPQELRVGILTAFIGAPFFLFLLIRQRTWKNYAN